MPELYKMFLNLDDFENVPQYPGYRGYQLLEALHAGYIPVHEGYIIAT